MEKCSHTIRSITFYDVGRTDAVVVIFVLLAGGYGVVKSVFTKTPAEGWVSPGFEDWQVKHWDGDAGAEDLVRHAMGEYSGKIVDDLDSQLKLISKTGRMLNKT